MTKPESPKLTPEQINNIYSNHSADMLHDPEFIGNQEVSQDEVTYSENRTQGKKVTFLIKLILFVILYGGSIAKANARVS